MHVLYSQDSISIAVQNKPMGGIRNFEKFNFFSEVPMFMLLSDDRSGFLQNRHVIFLLFGVAAFCFIF